MSNEALAYRKFVRMTGLVDLVLFTALALPFVSTMLLSWLFSIGSALGDTRVIPNLSDPFVMLAINLVGIFGLFTVWLRIKGSADDCGSSIGVLKLFAAALFGFSVFNGAPLVLIVFMSVDLITGIQLLINKGRVLSIRN